MTDFASVLFDLFMMPLEKRKLAEIRKEMLTKARGDILEIGAGTGVNIKYYDSRKVKSLTLLDIDITETLRYRCKKCSFPVKTVETSAEQLPFAGKSFDTIVVTLVLCSIPAINEAMDEIYRVLKDDGQLFFLEHVLAPHRRLATWQNLLTEPWKKVAGGCHLNRDTRGLLEQGGFKINEFQSFWSDIFIYGKAVKSERSSDISTKLEVNL